MTKSQLSDIPGRIDTQEKRTLEQLQHDHQGFMARGGATNKAKEHHNVIHPFVFNVPLDQVSFFLFVRIVIR